LSGVRETPLAGTKAVVTGGSSGIGAAIVGRLAAAGAEGFVLDLRPVAEGALPSGWSALVVDVGDDGALRSAFDRVGARIGVLVAAAGIVPPWRRLEALDLDEWDEVFRVNVRGVASTLHHAVASLADGAAVIVIASLNAWRGDANLPAYTASKHAVLGLVRSAALDLGRRGIRVNALGPGPIATAALLDRIARREARGGPPVLEALERAAAETALGRIASVEEVAEAALFLATAASSGVTGHLLPVDAGLL
jgi:NAD(P)-dependent dehydrogenase (short-subunit alcohol dehydrogenase family)